jgi:hypothetical protein
MALRIIRVMEERDFTEEIGYPTRPTLQAIARKTYLHGLPDDEKKISDALIAVGFHPTDEPERERFRRLVKAETYGRNADQRDGWGDSDEDEDLHWDKW